MSMIFMAVHPRRQLLSYFFVPSVHFKSAEFGFQVLTPVLYPHHFLPSYHPSLSSDFPSTSDPLAKAELLYLTTRRYPL